MSYFVNGSDRNVHRVDHNFHIARFVKNLEPNAY